METAYLFCYIIASLAIAVILLTRLLKLNNLITI